MATVRLIEASDSNIGYGYLTVYNLDSQREIEKEVLKIREMLQKEYSDKDGVPFWDLEDFKNSLPKKWNWEINDEYEIGI